MSIALLTTYLAPYRVPLYERLARRHDLEVLCFGGGHRYVPPWFADLDSQLQAAPFPARRLDTIRGTLAVAQTHDTVIAPFAGGAFLPAAYAGARRSRRAFVLWASVWAQPRSIAHALALPATRHIYRHADAVIAYGEHVRRFVARIRGRDGDIFIAPQSVEPELFGRTVSEAEIDRFRTSHALPRGDLVLYSGRIVEQKGIQVLLEAWRQLESDATLIIVGDGPLAAKAAEIPRARVIGPLAREQLPIANAASTLAVLPSIPTARFREPWGLVCNEAMEQARPVVASDAVGAVAGGLVRHEQNGLVVPAGDPRALAHAIGRILSDATLRNRLGEAARASVGPYTYEAMADAFERAIATAGARRRA